MRPISPHQFVWALGEEKEEMELMLDKAIGISGYSDHLAGSSAILESRLVDLECKGIKALERPKVPSSQH